MSEFSIGAAIGVLVFGIANGLIYEALVAGGIIAIFEIIKFGLSKILDRRIAKKVR